MNIETNVVIWKNTGPSGALSVHVLNTNGTNTFTYNGTSSEIFVQIRQAGTYYLDNIRMYRTYQDTVFVGGFDVDMAYRYGFNSMERDNEIKGRGNSYDFGVRLYDSRLGRWLSRDAASRVYSNLSSYSFVANNPLIFVDPSGNIIEPAPGLLGKEKEEVKALLQRFSEERVNQYKYLNELRYHPENKTFLSKGDEGYDEAFDIIIHVTISDLDGRSRTEEVQETTSRFGKVKFSGGIESHQKGETKKTSLWQSYQLTNSENEIIVRKENGDVEKFNINSPEDAKRIDEEMSNGSVRSEERRVGKECRCWWMT